MKGTIADIMAGVGFTLWVEIHNEFGSSDILQWKGKYAVKRGDEVEYDRGAIVATGVRGGLVVSGAKRAIESGRKLHITGVSGGYEPNTTNQ